MCLQRKISTIVVARELVSVPELKIAGKPNTGSRPFYTIIFYLSMALSFFLVSNTPFSFRL